MTNGHSFQKTYDITWTLCIRVQRHRHSAVQWSGNLKVWPTNGFTGARDAICILKCHWLEFCTSLPESASAWCFLPSSDWGNIGFTWTDFWLIIICFWLFIHFKFVVSISSTYPCESVSWLVGWSVTLSTVLVSLGSYRASVDHGTWYIFWMLWPTAFRCQFPKYTFRKCIFYV